MILQRLFTGRLIACDEAADTNNDGRLNVADAIRLLGYLFLGDAPLAPPLPGSPGPDLDGDELTCEG